MNMYGGLMKNKKSIIIIISILIIIITIATILIIKKAGNNNQKLVKTAETSIEQRTLWDNFLNSNPYLSQIENISEYINDTDLIKLAITSDNVETERIVTEEIQKRHSLSLGDGYKKSKNNINQFLKEILNQENIAYNFVDTYVEEDNYLIIGEDYVYFTKIGLPEKIYIAVKYEEKNGKYEVQIYEYNVTEANRENLKSMLETGNINKEIAITSKYIFTGQIESEKIKIDTKTSL